MLYLSFKSFKYDPHMIYMTHIFLHMINMSFVMRQWSNIYVRGSTHLYELNVTHDKRLLTPDLNFVIVKNKICCISKCGTDSSLNNHLTWTCWRKWIDIKKKFQVFKKFTPTWALFESCLYLAHQWWGITWFL